MGAYSEALAVFGASGRQIYPTLPDTPTRAMVRRPAAFRAQSLDPKFADANAAIIAGAANDLTVVDIDDADPHWRDMAVEWFGSTPLEVQTPSGGRHLYYRHSGEPRKIKPWPNVPIDVLGSGTVVVPPSVRGASDRKPAGAYRFDGDLVEVLTNLPHVQNLPPELFERDTGGAAVGERNNTLFAKARQIAAQVDDNATLLEALRRENDRFSDPLPDDEVKRTAASVWGYKRQGRLFLPGQRAGVLDLSEITTLSADPTALALLAFLRSHHDFDHTFAISPEGISESGALLMTPKTIRRARNFLLTNGIIEEVAPSIWMNGRRLPAQFRLVKKLSVKFTDNRTIHAPPLVSGGLVPDVRTA